jgi:sugar/nucleoside kinase (ribokinase family)
MTLLVTGSIGLDDVQTPHGSVRAALGGTAVYFSLAARLFAPVRLVAVVGEDFPPEHLSALKSTGIDLSGLEVRCGSRTFRWHGRYEGTMNECHTVGRELGVLAEDPPRVPAAFLDSAFVFLANTHPTLQRSVREQLAAPRLVVCDTMDLWIAQERESLLATLRCVDGVIINDGEARALTGEWNLFSAGEAILRLGPRFAIIKKGEHGALVITPEGRGALPAFAARAVRDPTGAGDSFAGGVMGYLSNATRSDLPTLNRAMVRGMVAASFTIEDFSIHRLARVTREEFDGRLGEYLEMLRVGD